MIHFRIGKCSHIRFESFFLKAKLTHFSQSLVKESYFWSFENIYCPSLNPFQVV